LNPPTQRPVEGPRAGDGARREQTVEAPPVEQAAASFTNWLLGWMGA
jgi:hypothetical protein